MNRDLFKEKRVHGNTVFPFGVYYIDTYHSNTVFDCHWHDELEFLLVTKGKATFQIETQYYEVTAGEAIFINSGEMHAGFPVEHDNCIFTALVFNPSILYNDNIYDPIQVKFIEPIIKKHYKLPVHIKNVEGFEKNILMMVNEIINVEQEKAFTYELLVKAGLYNIFSLMLTNTDLTKTNDNYLLDNYKTERVKKAMEYIYDNYNKKISLKELSSELNMSEGHFCRFFKQMLRKTPMEYINYYRINKAARLLESSNKKIIEISIDTGFDNVSYFASTFKQYMKCSPSEYRRANK